jgi:hypothetical protein
MSACVSADSDRLSRSIHVATLLALLRAGEQSAAAAFSRIARRLSAGEISVSLRPLSALIEDEERHDNALATFGSLLPPIALGDPATRRFFRRLESREPTVHLARVAALDACVCQILTRVLAYADQRVLEPRLTALLSGIRADEARHVRVTRELARLLGADLALLRGVNAEVRNGFVPLLLARAQAFEALRVDSTRLVALIRREQ